MSETPGTYTDSLTLIEKKTHLIRGQRVILDADLAAFFAVPTPYLNELAGRNPRRFPKEFRFRLTPSESADLPAAETAARPRRARLPFAFTESGVAMLATILHTPQAVRLSIDIIRAAIANHPVLPGLDLDVFGTSPYPNQPAALRVVPCLTKPN